MIDHKAAIEGLQSYLDAIDVNGTAIWDDYRPKLQAAIAALEALAAENAEAKLDVEALRHDITRMVPTSTELATENARLRQAIAEYTSAMEGFADAVRQATGRPWPWPAQEMAREKIRAAALNETAPPEDEAVPDD